MSGPRRVLTPVTITARYPTHSAGRTQAAVSDDGLWKYDRIEITGTPWDTVYVPTGESAWFSSLPKARAATADGSALAQIEARRQEAAA